MFGKKRDPEDQTYYTDQAWFFALAARIPVGSNSDREALWNLYNNHMSKSRSGKYRESQLNPIRNTDLSIEDAVAAAQSNLDDTIQWAPRSR